jgi:hypothetical protein
MQADKILLSGNRWGGFLFDRCGLPVCVFPNMSEPARFGGSFFAPTRKPEPATSVICAAVIQESTMSEKDEVRENEVIVDVYMAMQNAPTLYDYFITRNGTVKPNKLADPVPGIIQVVMGGMHPTGPQQLRLAGQFGDTAQYRIVKFY